MKYTSTDVLQSGLPLGGIGAGKVEIFPDGTLRHCNHQNNWESPLPELGLCFAVSVAAGSSRVTKLLQTYPLQQSAGIAYNGAGANHAVFAAGVPAECAVQHVEYEAEFPIATLRYADEVLPIEVTLTAFSSFIPHDCRNSGLPAANFRFNLHNPGAERISVSLLASCINTLGETRIGRVNELLDSHGLVGIRFTNAHPYPTDSTMGCVTLAVSPPKDASHTYLRQWNFYREPLAAWDCFCETGQLPNSESGEPVTGDADLAAGALAVAVEVPPGEQSEIVFHYTWFMPNHPIGHAYENWFGDSVDVAECVARNWQDLLARTQQWQLVVRESGLPGWFADALINNLYVLVSSSVWGRGGEFALYESAVNWSCALMSTTDLRYYYSFALAHLFPELERTEIREYVVAQCPDGYIPHDLGRSRLDAPSDGTTSPPRWKDLCLNFVLCVYRDYLWWQDEEFFREVYPAVKKAMEWEFATDTNGDGLPDNEGADQTFDAWRFVGTHAYTSSIFLAALLAAEKMAARQADEGFARRCRDLFMQGREEFERQLWGGQYYVACRSGEGRAYDACHSGQLSGQWYAHLLGLGNLLPPAHVKEAVKTICQLNGGASPYGVVNSVLPDGSIDTASNQSKAIWPGMSYAFASLAILEGFVSEGLELARKTWMNFVENQRSPWHQPDEVRSDDGSFGYGDHYLRSIAIWSVFLAMAQREASVKKAVDGLANGTARTRLAAGTTL